VVGDSLNGIIEEIGKRCARMTTHGGGTSTLNPEEILIALDTTGTATSAA
jgi:hypothetical protein